jgi:hypothetical protein
MTTTGATNVTFPTSGTLATTAGTVASFSAGSTGFTPNTATTGAVTLAGTLATTNGGTGLTSFTSGGVVYASSTSALTTGSALTFDGQTLTNARDTPILTLNDTAASNVALRLLSTGGVTYVQSGISAGAFSPIAFTANGGGTEQMRLTSTGLGIGTSSPAYKLDVNGTSKLLGNVGVGGNPSASTNIPLVVQNASGQDTQLLLTTTGVNNTVMGFNNSGVTNAQGIPNNTAYFGSLNSYPVAITNSGALVATFSTSGNLGIGTSSPGEKLQVAGAIRATGAVAANTTGGILAYQGSSTVMLGSWGADASTYGAIQFYQANSTGTLNRTAMTLDASGRLLVGVTSASGNAALQIKGATSGYARLEGTSSTLFAGDASLLITGGGATESAVRAEGALLFASGGATERARITSGGDFGIGNTNPLYRLTVDKDTTSALAFFTNSNASAPNGAYIDFSAASPNNATQYFLYCEDSTAQRATIRSNGGIANYSANNVNLSDRREKTNFSPAKSYLDTICAIPVQTFNYIDQSEDDPGLTLGVVAQDVQAVAPELVMESNWGTAEEPKQRLSIYQTDLQYALMKCVQELKAELDSVKAELATLKGQP